MQPYQTYSPEEIDDGTYPPLGPETSDDRVGAGSETAAPRPGEQAAASAPVTPSTVAGKRTPVKHGSFDDVKDNPASGETTKDFLKPFFAELDRIRVRAASQRRQDTPQAGNVDGSLKLAVILERLGNGPAANPLLASRTSSDSAVSTPGRSVSEKRCQTPCAEALQIGVRPRFPHGRWKTVA